MKKIKDNVSVAEYFKPGQAFAITRTGYFGFKIASYLDFKTRILGT